MIHKIPILVLLTKTPIDVDVVARPDFMPDKFFREATRRGHSRWHVMHSGRGLRQSHTAAFASVTKDQHLSHGSGSLRNWVDFIRESDFVVFLLLAQRLDPKADVPRRHGPSGWRVQARPRVGVRVKFGGWSSDEGQGYGRVGVAVRSKYPAPLGQRLSGHCLPLCPVRETSSIKTATTSSLQICSSLMRAISDKLVKLICNSSDNWSVIYQERCKTFVGSNIWNMRFWYFSLLYICANLISLSLEKSKEEKIILSCEKL